MIYILSIICGISFPIISFLYLTLNHITAWWVALLIAILVVVLNLLIFCLISIFFLYVLGRHYKKLNDPKNPKIWRFMLDIARFSCFWLGIRIKVDGEIKELTIDLELEKNKKHNVSVIIDRLVIKDGIRSRLYSSLETASKLSHGKVVIDVVGKEEITMSEDYACPYCDYSLEELEPRIFSFNAPYGSCPDCKGLGVKYKIDVDLVIPNKDISILDGAIKPINLDEESSIMYTELTTLADYYHIDLSKPVKDLTKEELNLILYGSTEPLTFNYKAKNGNTRKTTSYYEGIMMAGANFASSPARILIDFMDPIIVAEKIAVTDEKRFVTIKDIENELRDGQRGVSGTGGNGKKKLLTI